MSWIESHQSIATHPKLHRLSVISGYDPDICIAKLHRLWWWALQYAEDGDLNGFSDEEISYGIAISDTKNGKNFVAALRTAGWIDEKTNYIHDWFDYAQKYLYSKYHTYNPKKYQVIERKWRGRPKGIPKGMPKGLEKTDEHKPLVSQPNLDNLPNQPDLKKPPLPPQTEEPKGKPQWLVDSEKEETQKEPFKPNCTEDQRHKIEELTIKLTDYWITCQKWVKDKILNEHPEAIIHTLNKLDEYRPNNPFQYAEKIISIESGNYRERDFISESRKKIIGPEEARSILSGFLKGER